MLSHHYAIVAMVQLILLTGYLSFSKILDINCSDEVNVISYLFTPHGRIFNLSIKISEAKTDTLPECYNC